MYKKLFLNSLTKQIKIYLTGIALIGLISSSIGWADKLETMQKRLEKDKTVRRQKFLRSGRMVLSVGLGSSLGDTYRRSYPVSVSGVYYISDEFGIGGSAFYALNAPTALADELKKVRPARAGNDELFSAVDLGAGLDVYYTPIHGKLSLLGISALKYDLAVTGGVHFLSVKGAESDGFKPAPAVGINSNFFIDNQMAVTVYYKNFIYSRADHSVQVGEEVKSDNGWSMHGFGGLMFTYFTGKPTIGYE